jgi:PKD repeat protein
VSSAQIEIRLYAYASSIYINYLTIQPIAHFNYAPEYPLLGEPIVFNASASYDIDGFIANYTWDFGDGNITTATDPIITHFYTTEGAYIVNLTVTDDKGYTESETKTVIIDFTSPTTFHDYDYLWHTADFTINLTATDSISGVATIYYKINDGSTQIVSANGQPRITTEGANNKLEYWSVDKAGNEESHHILTNIKLDKTTPTGTITINNGYAYTTSTSVTLTLTAIDTTSGIHQVRYSNDGVWDTETWEDFSPTKTWTLTSGDGIKTVYYQIKDNAGLISTYSDTIILDTKQPTGSVTIAEGATYTKSPTVTLTLSAEDATSGVAKMRFSYDNSTWTSWEPYTSSKAWTLTANDGIKTVFAQFMDNAGLTSPIYQDTITLDATTPTANAGSDQTVLQGTTVTFDGSGSIDNMGIASYTWTFTDVTLQTLTGPNPKYTFNKIGNFQVTLNVSDYAGNWNTDTMWVNVSADTTSPIANAGPDQTVNEDTPVTFDGSGSSDNVGITAYTWTFTDVTVKTLTGEKPTYTFNTPGVYTITLNVTDAAGNWATDTVVITVLDVTRPIANAGQDQTVNVGTAVTFDAGGSTDNVGIVSYEWNFGDGTTGAGKTTTHTYANQETYTVTLTVKDSAGNSATDTITVTVLPAEAPPPPPAEAFPMWVIGAAIAAVALATAAATLILRKRRK